MENVVSARSVVPLLHRCTSVGRWRKMPLCVRDPCSLYLAWCHAALGLRASCSSGPCPSERVIVQFNLSWSNFYSHNGFSRSWHAVRQPEWRLSRIFCSRFCFNPRDKRTSVFLIPWHQLESILQGVSDWCVSRLSRKLCLHASLRFAVSSEHLLCGEVTVCLLRAPLISKSGLLAKVSNYLWSRLGIVSIAQRLYQVAF